MLRHNLIWQLRSAFAVLFVLSLVWSHLSALANDSTGKMGDAQLVLREHLRLQHDMVRSLGVSFQTDSISTITQSGSDNLELKRQLATHNLFNDSYDLRIRSWEGKTLDEVEADPGGSIPVIRNIWHNEQHYTHNQHQLSGLPPQHSVFLSKDRGEVYRYHSINYAAAPLSGYYANDPRPVAEVMLQAEDLQVVGQETIDGRPVPVVKARSRDGVYTVWVDKDRSHAIVRAEVEKLASAGHNYSGRNLSQQSTQIVGSSGTTEIATVDRITFKLGAVRLEEVHPGLWLPVEAEVDRTFSYSNGMVYQSKIRPIRTGVSVQPDFISLGAFELDVPDETEVFIKWAQGIDYVWRHGRPVLAVDEDVIAVIDGFLQEEFPGKKLSGGPIIQDPEASVEVVSHAVPPASQERSSSAHSYVWWILGTAAIMLVTPFLLKRVFSRT